MTKKMSAFPAETAIANIVNFIGQIAGPSNVLITPANAFINLMALGGAVLGVQQLIANGTYTPTAGTKKALVIACAPGGGGGGINTTAPGSDIFGCGGCGGAGELRAAVLSINTALTYTATVPAGGAGGATGNNAGITGADLKLNNGTTDVLICKGGVGGAGSAGNSQPSSGANGSGGTGGISLSGLVSVGSGWAWSTVSASYNMLFGSPVVNTGILGSASNLPVYIAASDGLAALGKGGGGVGAWKHNTSVGAAAGGAASGGYMLIIEFG